VTHKYKLRCRLSVNDYNRFLFFKLALTTCHESCHNVSNSKSHQTIFYVYICIIYKIDKNFDESYKEGTLIFMYRWWRADKKPQIRAQRTFISKVNNSMHSYLRFRLYFFEMVYFRSKTINLKSFFEYFFGIFGFFSLCRLKVRSPLVYFTERGRVFSVKAECWASPLWKKLFHCQLIRDQFSPPNLFCVRNKKKTLKEVIILIIILVHSIQDHSYI